MAKLMIVVLALMVAAASALTVAREARRKAFDPYTGAALASAQSHVYKKPTITSAGLVANPWGMTSAVHPAAGIVNPMRAAAFRSPIAPGIAPCVGPSCGAAFAPNRLGLNPLSRHAALI